jgi:hypothetical protein
VDVPICCKKNVHKTLIADEDRLDMTVAAIVTDTVCVRLINGEYVIGVTNHSINDEFYRKHGNKMAYEHALKGEYICNTPEECVFKIDTLIGKRKSSGMKIRPIGFVPRSEKQTQRTYDEILKNMNHKISNLKETNND